MSQPQSHAAADSPPQTDLGRILDEGPWSGFQKLVLLLSSIAVLMDGFDNQALGFALPALIKDWGLTRGDFVPTVTLGLLGMCFGAAIAGFLADRFGRRPMLIAAIALFGVATGAIALANDLTTLTILRIVATIGIGGAIPTATALQAEFSPRARRSLAVSIGMLCVPGGGLIGGVIAASVLPAFGWRPLFAIGGALPLLVAGVMLVALPESPRFLARRPERRPELLKILRRYGGFQDHGFDFVDSAEHGAPTGRGVLLAPAYRRDSLALWVAFFCGLFSNYLVFNWGPTMLSTFGYDLATASRGLAAFNFGGIGGSLVGAWLMDRYGSRRPLAAMATCGAVLAAILLSLLTMAAPSPDAIVAAFGAQGFFVAGLQVMLFALAAHIYPSRIRAMGVGAALAIGRLGAVAAAAGGAAIIGLGRGGVFGAIMVALVGAGVAVAFTRPRMSSRRGAA